MKISCIAVDDEPLALNKMKTFIEKVPYLNLLGTFDNGFDAIHFLRQEKVDLMFLDIQMDDLTGIQLLEALRKKPHIILTTAYDQYALKGYELNVSDYLLKPISFQRFLQAVEKIHDQVSSYQRPPMAVAKKIEPPKEQYILVRSEYRLQKIWLNDILYIEGMKDYSRICTHSQKVMTLQNLKRVEESLPTPPFLRVHKSYIVSLEKISSIGKNDMIINGQNIPVGGLYKKAFQNYIEKQNMIG
ncbi:MAG: response regulator transcription factor [Saprospiraceae bacterium]|nr:response regulator transcription factor [Saprospiraceae bacterium]